METPNPRTRIRRKLFINGVSGEFAQWFSDLPGKDQLMVLLMGELLSPNLIESPDDEQTGCIVSIYAGRIIPPGDSSGRSKLMKNSIMLKEYASRKPGAEDKIAKAIRAFYEFVYDGREVPQRFNIESQSEEVALHDNVSFDSIPSVKEQQLHQHSPDSAAGVNPHDKEIQELEKNLVSPSAEKPQHPAAGNRLGKSLIGMFDSD